MKNAQSISTPALIVMAVGFLCITGCVSKPQRIESTQEVRTELYSPHHSMDIIVGATLSGLLASVPVDTRFRKEDIEITVVACTNVYCRAGVKKLRNKEWDLALANFRNAIVVLPSDDCAFFGSGVAHELIADKLLASSTEPFHRLSRDRLIRLESEYDSALFGYRRACEILDQPPTRYSASRDRAEEKLRLIQEAIERRSPNDSIRH
ncbi:MAG: hypothetical protein ACLQVY_04930 [Limisphaerales bacterium]